MKQCELCGDELGADLPECPQCNSPANKKQREAIIQETIQLIAQSAGPVEGPHDFIFQVASFYRLCGEYDDAILWYERAIKANSKNPEYFRSLGSTLAAKGEYRSAIDMLRKAADMAPNYPDYHSDLGAAYFKEGCYDEAIAAFQRALELNPGYANAYNNLGLTYRKKGKFPEAHAAIKKATELEPQHAVATYALGLSYYCGGMFSQLQSAVRINAKILGDIYFLRKDYEEAVRYYTIAVQVHPSYADLRYHLGKACAAAGRQDAARKAFQEALKINPNYQQAKTALEKIKEGSP